MGVYSTTLHRILSLDSLSEEIFFYDLDCRLV